MRFFIISTQKIYYTGTVSRLIRILLCILSLSVCSCSPSNSRQASDRAVNPVPAEQLPSVESPRISAMLNNILQDWEGQDAFAEEFFTLSGVQLEIIQPPHQSYSDRVFLQLASNQVPDIIEVLPEYLPRLIQAELIIPLNKLIDKSVYLDDIDPSYLESVRHPDGNIYGFSARDGGGNVTYIRADWLENMGLQMPRNQEELLACMEAFTYGDPNRSGQDDTYAYTDIAAASQDWYNRLLMGKGYVEIYYNEEQKRWIDGFTTEESIKAYARIRNLYQRGLIDPDFHTNTTYSARTKFINGQVGIFTYWANHWARNLQDRSEAADTPDARIRVLPPFGDTRYLVRIPPVLVISAESQQPELVFREFIDKQYDKGPVQTLFTYGVQGTHWDIVEGRMQFLSNPLDPYQADFIRSYVPPGSSLNDWDLPVPLDPLVKQAQDVLAQKAVFQRQKWGGAYYNQYYNEIEQVLKPELLSSYYTGAISMEEMLELYRKRSQQYYLSEILEELNSKDQG